MIKFGANTELIHRNNRCSFRPRSDKAKDSLLVREPSRFTRCKILSQVMKRCKMLSQIVETLSHRHIKIVSIRNRRHGRMMPSSQFRINANNESILCIIQKLIFYITVLFSVSNIVYNFASFMPIIIFKMA